MGALYGKSWELKLVKYGIVLLLSANLHQSTSDFDQLLMKDIPKYIIHIEQIQACHFLKQERPCVALHAQRRGEQIGESNINDMNDVID